jgi:hypothetical protein
MSEGVFIEVLVFVLLIQMAILPPSRIITTLLNYKGEVVFFTTLDFILQLGHQFFSESSSLIAERSQTFAFAYPCLNLLSS